MSGRGPAHDLGKLYEALVAGGERNGKRVLQPQTVEAIIACHRRGMIDRTARAGSMPPHPKWGYEYPWGLGVMLEGNPDIGSANSPRVFGHSGALSSVGFGDPETGLACAIITNGLIPLDQNADRLGAVADAVNRAIVASA
jgi:CubicO group peptidase (beta-lactamase class C family)